LNISVDLVRLALWRPNIWG